MSEKFAELARSRGIHLAAVIALIAVLSPTPYPASFAARLQAATTALNAGRPELALPSLEQALEIEPGSNAARLLAAQSALASSDAERATKHLNALSHSTQDYPCLWLEISIRDGDFAETFNRITQRETRRCITQVQLLQHMAAELFITGDYEAALPILEALSRSQYASAEVNEQLGTLLAVQAPRAALSYLSLAVEMDPQTDATTEALIESIEQARATGDPAFVLAQVGQTLARQGEWALAATSFANALALEPDYTEARAYYGLALDRSGGNGLKHLERAAEEAPQAPLPQSLLGKHWRARGDVARSVEYFERAAVLGPDDPVLAVDLGAAYAAAGDFSAARLAYQHAAHLSPDDVRFWLLLAQFTLDYEVEVLDVGLPAARRALLLRPFNADTLDGLGYTYFLVGNWTLAERFLHDAVAADNSSASARYHLGLVELASGKLSLGKQSLAAATALDPDGRVGALARRSLENLLQ